MSDRLFIVPDFSKNNYSYAELIKFVNEHGNEPGHFVNDADPFIFFSKLLTGLVNWKEITLFDDDFSSTEITRLVGAEAEKGQTLQTNHPRQFHTIDDLLSTLNEIECSRINIFTSGTTGLPKKVTHSLSSLTRNIRVSDHHQKDIWGLSYSPSHMAGLQVFFQALYNKNPLVQLLGKNRVEVVRSVETHKITHLSATPSFYRLLIPCEKPLTSVRSLTSGGEIFSESIRIELERIFPNAHLHNIYASTEAGSLLEASEEFFEVPVGLKKLLRIIKDELCIHKSLLGEFSSSTLRGDWYHTNDIVEIVQKEPLKFRFVSRKNEMINVGGFKVNPHEVEETLLQMAGIKDVRVFGKRNSVLGHILVCEIVTSDPGINEPAVREWLSVRLQNFKIPRQCKFVESIEQTKTGKKKRDQ